jgi:hypothetical protein
VVRHDEAGRHGVPEPQASVRFSRHFLLVSRVVRFEPTVDLTAHNGFEPAAKRPNFAV